MTYLPIRNMKEQEIFLKVFYKKNFYINMKTAEISAVLLYI